MKTFIVLIPTEDNHDARKQCELIENNKYSLDNETAYNILLEVNKSLGLNEGSKIEVEALTDFMDRVNDEEFNPDLYFISYVHSEMREEMLNSDKIRYIKDVIRRHGAVTCAELEAEASPCISVIGDTSVLVEEFNEDVVNTFTYVNGMEVNSGTLDYDELDVDVIDDIYTLIEEYETEQDKTAKRIED